MFNLFRINDSFRFILLAVFFVLARAVFVLLEVPLLDFQYYYLLLGERLSEGFLAYRDIYDHTAPMAGLIYKYLNMAFGKSLLSTQIMSTLLLIINAGIFNSLLNKARAYKELTYLPAFFYVAFSLSIPDGFFLSPELLASTFLLLAAHQIVRKLEDNLSDESFTYSGLFVGIAALFYLPALLFSLLFIVGLMVLSSISIRRLFLYLYGVVLPLMIVFIYFHWSGSTKYLLASFWSFSLFGTPWQLMNSGEIWLFSLPIVAFTFLGLLFFFGRGRYTNNQVNIGLFFIGFGLLSSLLIVVYSSANTMSLVLLLPMGAYSMTHFALLVKRRWTNTITSTLFIVIVIIMPYFWHIRTIYPSHELSKSTLPVLGSRVLIFSDNLTYYNQATIAGPVLQPALARNFLNKLDTYESAITLYSSIERSDPYIIVDDWGIMSLLERRFPDWVAKYRKGSGVIYYKKSNN